MEQQMSLFPETEDFRPPVTVTWNGWHGCTNYVVLHIICIMRFYSYVEQV